MQSFKKREKGFPNPGGGGGGSQVGKIPTFTRFLKDCVPYGEGILFSYFVYWAMGGKTVATICVERVDQLISFQSLDKRDG